MESAIGKTITFGASRKMEVVSERVINNLETYSFVEVRGSRGVVKMAMRRQNGSYRLLN